VTIQVALSGTANSRDIGGLATVDGARVRSGRLFRSASLQAITADGVDTLLRQLGVRTIIDLRSSEEAVDEGRGLLAKESLCYVNVPLVDLHRPSEGEAHAVLGQYLHHLAYDENLPLAIEAIAAAVHHPTIVHCAAGKDRTGVVMALVELLIGVDEEQVVEDYIATAEHMAAVLAMFRRWPRYRANMECLPPAIYRCEELVIRGLLAELKARYGGAHGWAATLGVSDHMVAALCANLIDH
jgi:protein-tyrosine phosphatase